MSEKMVTASEVRTYLDQAIASFDADPPDSRFLQGYLAALETVRSDLFKSQAMRAADAMRRTAKS